MILRESSLLRMDIFQYQRMIVFAPFHSCKRTVQVDWIVMGIGKITVLNHQIPGRTRSVYAVCKAYNHVPGAFSWSQITVSVIDVFAHLDQPAKPVHIMDIYMIRSYIFTLPGKGSRRLTVRIGCKLNDGAFLLHMPHTVCF